MSDTFWITASNTLVTNAAGNPILSSSCCCQCCPDPPATVTISGGPANGYTLTLVGADNYIDENFSDPYDVELSCSNGVWLLQIEPGGTYLSTAATCTPFLLTFPGGITVSG